MGSAGSRVDALELILHDYLTYKGTLPEWDEELLEISTRVLKLLFNHAHGGGQDWIADQLELDEERTHCVIQKLCEEGKTFIHTEEAMYGRNGHWRLTPDGWLEAAKLCSDCPQ